MFFARSLFTCVLRVV